MPVTELRIKGYRSVLDLSLSLKRVNVIVGANGCGKSNVYRAITLLSAAANGRLAQSLAEEGGMPSVMWAGPRKDGPVRVEIGVSTPEFSYDLALGLPKAGITAFRLDPVIKEERLTFGSRRDTTLILERGTSSCKIRDAEGQRNTYTMELDESSSVMAQIVDAHRYPLLAQFRRVLTDWRFYHQFRSDSDSPMRRSQVGVRTWALSSDGSDLASALQTIRENGDGFGLNEAIAEAFEGAQLITQHEDDRFEVMLHRPGIQRPFDARELSDGTIRYLCLLAALMSPKPAPLIALNEPESNLHPNLLKPLAQLIAKASERSQIWITTHSFELAELIQESAGVAPIRLCIVDGETRKEGQPKGRFFQAED
jgi:predicted ATPase